MHPNPTIRRSFTYDSVGQQGNNIEVTHGVLEIFRIILSVVLEPLSNFRR